MKIVQLKKLQYLKKRYLEILGRQPETYWFGSPVRTDLYWIDVALALLDNNNSDRELTKEDMEGFNKIYKEILIIAEMQQINHQYTKEK